MLILSLSLINKFCEWFRTKWLRSLRWWCFQLQIFSKSVFLPPMVVSRCFLHWLIYFIVFYSADSSCFQAKTWEDYSLNRMYACVKSVFFAFHRWRPYNAASQAEYVVFLIRHADILLLGNNLKFLLRWTPIEIVAYS